MSHPPLHLTSVAQTPDERAFEDYVNDCLDETSAADRDGAPVWICLICVTGRAQPWRHAIVSDRELRSHFEERHR